MKFVLFAALAGSAIADPFATDVPPDHTVYNCQKVRQDVDEANDIIGDGNCDAEVNCGPFSYDLGDCWQSADDVCAGDSWYTNGRKNFRCSTKTGGIRLGRAGSNDDTGSAKHDPWTNPCDCYQECLEIAEREAMPLVAFDHYSGKCRCWSGTCDASDTGSLPCRNGGDSYGVGGPLDGSDNGEVPDDGNNWRCPSEIYFPELKYDCDGNDITFRYPNIQGYLGDGFCDDGSTTNQMYGSSVFGDTAFNFNCAAYDYDGGDCQLDCHESIYWATDFANLGNAFTKIDECTMGEPVAQTAFTTACDCYSFCANAIDNATTPFLFDHDQADMCRCWEQIDGAEATLAQVANTADSTSFCGLNSNCQIYEPNRESDCAGTDYTLGVYGGEGMTYDNADMANSTVTSWDSYLSGNCVESAMCLESSYSNGACFECDRFSTDRVPNSYCADGIEMCNITMADLDQLIADGYLQGDVSTDGDNCGCLNYCFSHATEYFLESSQDTYDLFNFIAGVQIAYAENNGVCSCYNSCNTVTTCDAANCNMTSFNQVYYSTVADLNTLE